MEGGGRRENLSESSKKVVEVLHHFLLNADWLTLQMLSCPCDMPAGLLRGLVVGTELAIL